MKKLFLLYSILISISANAQSDPQLFPVNSRKLGAIGYYLKDGTNIVKPQFCTAGYNRDGYYIVSKGEHQYDEYGRRNESHIPNTEKFGVLNSKGQFIIDFNNNYDGVNVENGVIYVTRKNKYGTVNEKNEVVVPIEYDDLRISKHNLIVAEKNKKYGMLNYVGKIIVPFQYDFIQDPLIDEKRNTFLVIVQKDKKSGVLDQTNKFRIPIGNILLTELTEKSIIAIKNKKYGLLDYNAKIILPFDYENMNYYENIIAIKNGYEYYYKPDGMLIERKLIDQEGVKTVPK